MLGEHLKITCLTILLKFKEEYLQEPSLKILKIHNFTIISANLSLKNHVISEHHW